MLYLIADIKTKVPEAGGMASRCRDYVIDAPDSEAEIVIDDSKYRAEKWSRLDENGVAYMESALQFYLKLLDFDGMMLHASATVIDGEAYLFAGQSGIGKSTHAALLKDLFPGAMLINDDKPAVRCVGGKWIAYGTPWSGKHGININAGYPLKAVCLLSKRRDRNEIRRADSLTAVTSLIACSTGRSSRDYINKLAPLIDRLMKDIPVYEMDSLANGESAEMAYNAMKNGL